jgi:hypothetical protein
MVSRVHIGVIEYEPTLNGPRDIHLGGKPLVDQLVSSLQRSTISVGNPFVIFIQETMPVIING